MRTVRSFPFMTSVLLLAAAKGPHPGNATTNDLWSALSQASKQDVNSFMVSGVKIRLI